MCKHLLAPTKTKDADTDAFLANINTHIVNRDFLGHVFVVRLLHLGWERFPLGDSHFPRKGVLKPPLLLHAYCSSNHHHVPAEGILSRPLWCFSSRLKWKPGDVQRMPCGSHLNSSQSASTQCHLTLDQRRSACGSAKRRCINLIRCLT